MLLCYKNLMNESDIIRVTILSTFVQLTKIFHEPEFQKSQIQSINNTSIDKSWHVSN
jgi:hypothetical protein